MQSIIKILSKKDDYTAKHSEGVADIVIYHHEMMDGSGYPKGLTGDQIPVLSQILAVADVFNALTTDRPYRKKLSPDNAIKIMEGMPLNKEMVGILRYIKEKRGRDK